MREVPRLLSRGAAVDEHEAECAEVLLGLCEQEGFALAGAAPLQPSEHAEALCAWVAAGKHGGMSWLADTVEQRLDPNRVLPGAESVVMVADFYARRGETAEPAKPGHGRIARYARGRDYHKVLKRRVQRVCDRVRERYPDAKTRPFCDTAPVLERELAALCGLGWIGKHSLLIHPTHGSWMLLGGFFTTLKLEPTAAPRREPDHCGSCTRCIDACPTNAITPYSIDAQRCISYLTIEDKGTIEPHLAERLDGWIFGCDVCQEVCPHNSPRTSRGKGVCTEVSVREEYTPRRASFDLLEVLGWDEATRRSRFTTSAMKRATLAQMKRNAIALAAKSAAHRPRVEELAWDPNEPDLVRRAAREALAARTSTGPQASPAAPPRAPAQGRTPRA